MSDIDSNPDSTYMDEAELTNLLDHHGSDPASWPAARAAAAQALLEGSASARRHLDDARALETWLRGQRQHRAPDLLAATIMARVTQPDRIERVLAWLTAALWRPMLIAALPVIAGFAIGIALPEPAEPDFAEAIGSLAFVDIYEELNDAERP